MNWRSHLRDGEVARIEQIEAELSVLKSERRQIWERARKREQRARYVEKVDE